MWTRRDERDLPSFNWAQTQHTGLYVAPRRVSRTNVDYVILRATPGHAPAASMLAAWAGSTADEDEQGRDGVLVVDGPPSAKPHFNGLRSWHASVADTVIEVTFDADNGALSFSVEYDVRPYGSAYERRMANGTSRLLADVDTRRHKAFVPSYALSLPSDKRVGPWVHLCCPSDEIELVGKLT